MAFSTAPASATSTSNTESCKPAPETFSKSSLLAEDRIATRVFFGKAATTSLTTCGSICNFATLLRNSNAFSSTAFKSLLDKAFSNASAMPSKDFPQTTLDIAPKGIAQLIGVRKRPSVADSAANFCNRPAEAALAPTVLGKALSAWSTAKTAVSFRLICPTDAFGAELPFAAATSLASDKASAPTAVTSTSPLLATTNLQGFPSASAAFSWNKPTSAVHAKVTPNCLARTARWLRTGKSRCTTTPRQPGAISSSPEAVSQNAMAPSFGNVLLQSSSKARTLTTRPSTVPGLMATQFGNPAVRLEVVASNWLSLETWKRMEARSSASKKTSAALLSMGNTSPSIATLAYASESLCCKAKQTLRQRSADAKSRRERNLSPP
mmetsp:Transcript_37524/g.86613  ORF Transcript_37524/g.86613 Transcript_37524/m.86613 type:complete len:380 (+) Transcript_37524:615-1754(+)